MQNLFNAILKMSVSAVPVIVIVLCLRQIFKKYPKSYSFALWLVVFASLTLPFKIPVNITLPTEKVTNEITQTIVQEFAAETAQGGTQQAEQNVQTAQNEQNGTQKVPLIIQQAEQQTNVTVAQNAVHKKLFTLQLWHIWMCGILVLVAFEIVNLKGIYDKTRFAFKKQGNIYLCDEIGKPFVFGIARPKIFIPSDISPQNEQYVTQHEQTHIDRRDYITKPLCFTIAAVHWFNPFVWLAFYLMEKDMELSCDEKVAKNLDTAGVQQYGTALLAFAVKDKPYKINAVLFGEGNCTMRIKNILQFKQPKKLTAILLSVCVLFAGCTAFATGQTEAESTNNTAALYVEHLDTGVAKTITDENDIGAIAQILSAQNWQEGTADCLSEFKITLDGKEYYYHADCSTVNDNTTDRSLSLTDEQKSAIDRIIASMPQTSGESSFNYKELWVKETAPVDIMWFSDATFVGDSMTEGLRIYTTITNSVGDIASFVSAKNLSPADFVSGTIDSFEHLTAQNGTEAIASTNPKKIYITLGTNSLVEMSEEDFLKEYAELIKTLKEKVSSAQIYVCSIPPMTKDFVNKRDVDVFKPDNLQYINGQLAQLANDNGAYYLNLHEVLADKNGYLKEEYAYVDGMHMIPDAYNELVEYLMAHTVNESKDFCGYPTQEYFKEETENTAEIVTETETVDQWTGFPEVIHLPTLEAGKYVFPFDMTNESIRVSRGYVGQYPKHDGIDFSGPFGTEIFASADGKVIKSEESTTGDGNHVVIEHANGYYTLYAHCSELLVKEGDEVKQGDVIAKIGCTGNSTGNHLHFEFGFGYGSEPDGGLTLDPYTAISTRCAEDLNGVSISGEYQQTNNNSTVQTSIENEQYYTVQSGDSPISIAKAHKLNVDELYAMNPDIKENGVFVGDKVRVTQPIFGWPIGESPTGEGVRISRGFVGQYPEHNGVDIAGPKGTDILASADGRVVKALTGKDNYGNYIIIQHTGGYRTLYAHCSELLVKMGDYVNKGDVIAKMGSSGNATGNQLRFEIILENDVRIDPYTKW